MAHGGDLPWPGAARRLGRPDHWTAEPRKADALMVLPYVPSRVEEAGRHFDETVRRIEGREFGVTTLPEAGICKECDIRHMCMSEGLLR